MLHGFTDSWFSSSRVLPLLDNKYRVYILDQRGHGDSDRPVGGYALPQFGHCMGSFVSQHVASEAPDRVSKLVLIASATSFRNNTVLELQRESRTVCCQSCDTQP